MTTTESIGQPATSTTSHSCPGALRRGAEAVGLAGPSPISGFSPSGLGVHPRRSQRPTGLAKGAVTKGQTWEGWERPSALRGSLPRRSDTGLTALQEAVGR